MLGNWYARHALSPAGLGYIADAMDTRSKRTYRLSERAQARVREMTGKYGFGGSQDAVVEIAVDRLYREFEAAAEARRWANAAADRGFWNEATDLAREFSALETWPA
jgi:hypothetical protein